MSWPIRFKSMIAGSGLAVAATVFAAGVAPHASADGPITAPPPEPRETCWWAGPIGYSWCVYKSDCPANQTFTVIAGSKEGSGSGECRD